MTQLDSENYHHLESRHLGLFGYELTALCAFIVGILLLLKLEFLNLKILRYLHGKKHRPICDDLDF